MQEYDAKTNTFARIEPKKQRCLMPNEIQEVFKLCTLKEHYRISDHDNLQEQHNQRLRIHFRELGLTPVKPLSSVNVEDVHLFDQQIRDMDRQGKLDMSCHTTTRKHRATDEMGE